MGTKLSRHLRLRGRNRCKDVDTPPPSPAADGHVDILEVSRLPRRYEYKQLHEATDGFNTFVGVGGYSITYKGRLPNGGMVAVKRILVSEAGTRGSADDMVAVKRILVSQQARGSDDDDDMVAMKRILVSLQAGGGDDDDDIAEARFERELIAAASLQHINIVRFMGYCYDPSRRHRYIVYEFCENGSLDSWIFSNDAAHRFLSWNQRYSIAVDIAKALRYLHHDCYDKIIHLDVKPDCVLLDGGFGARLAGFWQSQVTGKDEEPIAIKGGVSLAYMSPERFLRGRPVSEKADVYGYGMMLLELVHGERSFDFGARDRYVAGEKPYPKLAGEWARRRCRDIKEVVEERLLEAEMKLDEEQVRILLYVALWCIQDDPELRPSMESVVAMLERKTAVEVPPEPGMMALELHFRGKTGFHGGAAASFTRSERLATFRRASLLRLLHTPAVSGEGDEGDRSFGCDGVLDIDRSSPI